MKFGRIFIFASLAIILAVVIIVVLVLLKKNSPIPSMPITPPLMPITPSFPSMPTVPVTMEFQNGSIDKITVYNNGYLTGGNAPNSVRVEGNYPFLPADFTLSLASDRIISYTREDNSTYMGTSVIFHFTESQDNGTSFNFNQIDTMEIDVYSVKNKSKLEFKRTA
jgi:hypothetical protein